ncbi:hypothetical protein [Gimesia sp.]|uniref:hypothetical protein n=1 Tax=Gimesia sp. TaxID=2024833 RepID=UPI003A939292
MRIKERLEERVFCFSRSIQDKFFQLWRCYPSPAVKHRTWPVANQIELLEDRTLLTAAFSEFVDPNQSDYNGFGETVVVLSTGNVVITSPYADIGGTDTGAVYLFNGATGDLISTLTGSSDYDYVGIDGVTALSNGNFVVSSSEWSNGSESEAGAVTFGSGITGVSGVVSAANSLVGSTSSDYVGASDYGYSAVTALTNGNYVVNSAYWDNGSLTDAGAVTFGDGTTGVSGVISSTNSLVGETEHDLVGVNGVTALTNGNYVVISPSWDKADVTDAGAVTFGNGSSGITGSISSGNSLVGSQDYDFVGYGGVTALSNGNYVVVTSQWRNGGLYSAGAVTFGNGTTGVTGEVSAANSLVGAKQYDSIGSDGVTALSNGNYVVSSSQWMNGDFYSAGAVTFGNGTTGVTGEVSAGNSLVGTQESDYVGYDGVTALSNGNYVVISSQWKNGDIDSAGAVTFGNGTTGITGEVSTANSLVGSNYYDSVGSDGVIALTNGNYVVSSSQWDNNNIAEAGAVTFGNGTTGVTGAVSAANSLVGSSTYDNLGYASYNAGTPAVVALSNGNYVVSTPFWSNGSIESAGAVTFANGTTGVSGYISAANSLVGGSQGDVIGDGGVIALSNGNYVVSSPQWSIGTKYNVGAVTFGNGMTGVTGFVSAINSLIGNSEYDNVGSGNYGGGTPGVVALSNGNYIVNTPYWDNGMTYDAGAVTYGNGTIGITGIVSELNSLIGGSEFDNVGSGYYESSAILTLSNGNYVVVSPYWDNDLIYDAGAVTLGDGFVGVTGVISETNSELGQMASTIFPDLIPDDVNNTFFVVFSDEGKVHVFSQGNPSPSVTLAEISDLGLNENASVQTVNLTGISASGLVPNELQVTATSSNTSLIPDPVVSYSSPDSTGSLTFTPVANQTGVATITVTVEDGGLDGNLATTGDNNTIQRTFEVTVYPLVEDNQTLLPAGFPGFVDPHESAGNGFGDTVVLLSTGNVVITSPYADIGGTDTGAVYLFNGVTGELISTLTGSTDYDHVGMDGVTALSNGNFVVSSSEWNNGAATEAGAVTFGNGITGVSGVVSAANSLVGSKSGDYVGTSDYGVSGVTALSNGNYVVSSPDWDNGSIVDAGAVTFGDGSVGVSGVISASNSLVGSSDSDNLGLREEYDHSIVSGITALPNGNYLVISSDWNNGSIIDAGAVTFGDGSVGVSGVVSETNSLVGSSNFDYVGVDGVTILTNGNYVVSSSEWNNGSETEAGAVTFGNGTTGVTGVVSAANSLIGETTDDYVGFNDYGYSAVTALANGNYVVTSFYWDNGGIIDAGAVTFGDGTTGVSGVISSTNSLVGSSFYDQLGLLDTDSTSSGITALANGNYLVTSAQWDNGSMINAGAVTFGDGDSGVTGVISETNSLVGSSDYDRVGYKEIYDPSIGDFVGVSGVTELTNGNYVVSSPVWDNGSVEDAGAVTFGNGTTGVTGVISTANSLVGSSSGDSLGYTAYGASGVTALANGNYVVNSSNWDNNTISDAGAVTFGNGTTGVTGEVSSSNSLVGTSYYDQVGYGGITELSNGNYVVISAGWDNGTIIEAGAVTWGSGTSGVTGAVTETNSLIGLSSFDQIGSDGVVALTNGNYVVSSSRWINGYAYNAGAVTFGNGTTGVTGVVSAANSLVGETIDDNLGTSEFGTSAVTALANGNYVVTSFYWDNGAIEDAGAVTFGDGTSGVVGVISASNSLVGSSPYDNLGFQGVTPLSNGNYVVTSSYWDNGSVLDAGAVTFGDGTTGITGIITETNSLIGITRYDNLGIDGIRLLSNGNYLVISSAWDNGTAADAGAVTIGDGDNGVSGRVSFYNSVTGVTGPANIHDIIHDEINSQVLVVFRNEESVRVFSDSAELPLLHIDHLSNLALYENAAEQTVSLTGISADYEEVVPLRVTATSSNTDLIPDPVVSYTSPGSTGSLTFTPVADLTGIATITVTIEGGGLDGDLDTTEDNDIIQRTFTVTVSTRVDIEMRVVNNPTVPDSNGEVSQLADHQDWVSEWATYWVELWVTTDSTSSQGISSVSLDLNYLTQYTSATAIQYGAAFSLNQAGTIQDSTGVVENLYAETNTTGLGISDYLLFARIKFESKTGDEVDIDKVNEQIGPYDLGLSVSSPLADAVSDNLVSTVLNPPESTGIYANPLDLNDDGLLNYRDLILLVSVYGVIPSQSDSNYAWAADLNQDDLVNYRDLIAFVSNYGKNKTTDPNVNYPASYPDSWGNLLQVSTQPQSEPRPGKLTQDVADEVLETAVSQIGEQLTSEQSELLANVKVKVVDLAGATLGRAAVGTIYLDVNAAGFGWFIDETPLDFSEFQYNSELSLIALPGSEAEGLVDLWTVINHELGHLLGYEHADSGLMEDVLDPGERKLADWSEDADGFFASLQEDTELLSF